MRKSVLDDKVFSCCDCGKRCDGHEIEMSATKLIRCSECLKARQWATSMRKMA